ncbi:MAG: four helix bundle protein [Nitrospiraceae bacterium]
MGMKNSIVGEKSYLFALKIVALVRVLRAQSEYELARQVLRSGTSIGANIEEALAGVSRPDFISKMGIATKEARETRYWLRLLRDSKTVPSNQINPIIEEAGELLRMLTSIVKTSRETAPTKLKTHNSQLITKRLKYGQA